MLISSVVLGIAAGLALGGRFSRLGQLQIAWWPILIVAVALRLIAPALDPISVALYLIAFAGIGAVAIANRAVPGMLLIGGGSALNLVVVAANGGMPVDPAAAAAAGAVMPGDRLHLALDSSSRLPLLADVIPVPIVRGVYSAGDVLLAFGGFWVPFAWLRRP